MNQLLNQLNSAAWQQVNAYQNLQLGGKTVSCPYAINFFTGHISKLMHQANLTEQDIARVSQLYKDQAIEYGWFRGKGSPQQITQATEELAVAHGYNLAISTPQGMSEFMKLFGLGVDCSGFVWHCLNHAWTTIYPDQDFSIHFTWPSPDKTGPNYAGSYFWAQHSQAIPVTELQPLDLVLLKEDHYAHVALVLSQNNIFHLVQSNISHHPTGINVSRLNIHPPHFDYTPNLNRNWNDLPSTQIEFRRLNLLQQA